MNPEAVTRRLAAILMADVAGYSRLMERDETGTHVRLRAIQSEVMETITRRHHGRIVSSAGDGYLAEFPSATEALRCAVAVQKEMADRNKTVAVADRIALRIGVNVSDILYDKHDVAGGGVNLAARLEKLAKPGGICVSLALREQVLEDIGVHYVDSGLRRVKNISRPVRTFDVLFAPPTRLEALHVVVSRLARDRRIQAIAVSVLVPAVAALLYAHWRAPVALDGPDKLTVAVLPFTSRSVDQRSAGLAGDLKDQLFMALSPERHMLKVRRVEAFGNADGTADLSRLRNRNGARYAVIGEVSSEGGQLNVDARLIDTTSETVVWGDRINIPARFQDQASRAVARRLANALHGEVFVAEIARLRLERPRDPDATELVIAGYEVFLSGDIPAAVNRFEAALRLHPGNVPALLALSYALQRLDRKSGGRLTPATLMRVDTLTLAAVKSDPSCADSWIARSEVLASMEQPQAAAAAADRALGINPLNAWAESQRDALRITGGRPGEAIRPIEEITFLYARSHVYRVHLELQCRARINAVALDNDAVDACERWHAEGGGDASRVHLVALYALRGELDKGSLLLTQLLKTDPSINVSTTRASSEHTEDNSPAYATQLDATFYRGLRLAGMPER